MNTTVVGSMMAVKKYKNIEIILFGDKEKITPLLTDSTRITVVDTKVTISMGEKEPMKPLPPRPVQDDR